MSKNLCVVIVGVVASGKTSIIDRLVKELRSAVMMRTFTTRAPRENEVANGDRIFVTEEEFRQKIASGELIEWDEHCGFYYGSSWQILKELWEKYQVVLVNLNYVGARAFQEKVPGVVTIFLSAPIEQIRARVERRGKMEPAELERRLATAKAEMAAAQDFDYRVENADGQLDQAVERIKKIIQEKLVE